MDACSVGADDRDGFQFGAIERQQPAFVLEQSDRAARGFGRQFLMRLAVRQFRRSLRIDVWIFEEAEREFGAQDIGHSPVQRGGGNSSLFYQFRKRRIDVRIGKFYVHTGFEREFGRFGSVSGDMMKRLQLLDRVMVRGDQTSEPLLLSHYLLQKYPVGSR